jgi:hypothetical protein
MTIPDAKQRGEWAEACFLARAAEQGFRVSKPWGDSARYDFALECDGRFLRVQVKSTTARFCGGYVCMLKSSRCQHYTTDQVDFFAIYVIPEDVWYILPAAVGTRLKGHFMLNPHNPRQKYRVYKEAWHLFRESHPAANSGSEDTAPEDTVAEDPAPSELHHAPLDCPATDAQPGQIPQLVGTVEDEPEQLATMTSNDAFTRRMEACFDRVRAHFPAPRKR